VRGNPKVNALFVAEVFNTRNGLIPYEGDEIPDDDSGTPEERAFRYWINSLGLDDCFINNLYLDLSDGVALLKVCDHIKPGCVDWKKVVKKEKMTKFDHQGNCDYAFDVCENTIGKKCVGVGGVNILNVDKKGILAITWQLCRVHYLQLLDNKSEPEIMAWANSVVEGMEITSFGDKQLRTSHYLLKVIASINPGYVNWELVNDGIEEDDAKDNAKYMLGLCKKLGAVIFAAWEHVAKSDKKMMLILICSLYDIAHRN
jgi:hypothetical protein